ncbi:MAG TPA: hypothetical protein VGK24_18765 [Candidatus Angelobacter sp.]|jgi:transposase
MNNLSEFTAVENVLREAESKAQFQRILCVWLKALFSLNSEGISRAIGWKSSTVRGVQARFKKEGMQCLMGTRKGGRRRENMSFDREARILYKFVRQAKNNPGLDVGQIKQAYELSIGKQVPWSTVYRLIARHKLRHLLPKRRV